VLLGAVHLAAATFRCREAELVARVTPAR